MYEIERKFLVIMALFPGSDQKDIIKQGYLSVDPERIVRVRIEAERAWLTIKGKVKGLTRREFEYPIPVEDAEELLRLTLFPAIEKIRHRVEYMGVLWEVDRFLGVNEGLVLAEVELMSENQEIVLPPWVGMEVTSDIRYYNSWLSEHPFSLWK